MPCWHIVEAVKLEQYKPFTLKVEMLALIILNPCSNFLGFVVVFGVWSVKCAGFPRTGLRVQGLRIPWVRFRAKGLGSRMGFRGGLAELSALSQERGRVRS